MKTSMDAPIYYDNAEAGAWVCGYEDGIRDARESSGISNFTAHELREIAAYFEWKVSCAVASGAAHEKSHQATKDRSYKCTVRRSMAELAAKAMREYADGLPEGRWPKPPGDEAGAPKHKFEMYGSGRAAP
jgi:hypothetical protein